MWQNFILKIKNFSKVYSIKNKYTTLKFIKSQVYCIWIEDSEDRFTTFSFIEIIDISESTTEWWLEKKSYHVTKKTNQILYTVLEKKKSSSDLFAVVNWEFVKLLGNKTLHTFLWVSLSDHSETYFWVDCIGLH